MLDRGKFWTPAPAEGQARFTAAGVTVTPVRDLSQVLVSWAGKESQGGIEGFGPPVGFAGIASGPSYAIAVARDRAVLVSSQPIPLAEGWDAEAGRAVTPLDDAMLVLDIAGPGLRELLSKATPLAPDDPTPSASLLFAGLPCLAYRRDTADTLRLHVERPLAPTLAEWLRQA